MAKREGHPVPTLRGEPDLLVFVSSVTEELRPSRQIAKQAILDFPGTQPWLFEDTPASSESPTELYLRKVAEADLVIWLIGCETRKPVVDELHACRNARRRLLAFNLPCAVRDPQTNKLVKEVGNYAKWRDIPSTDVLADEIEAALSDEMVKQFRGPAQPTRAQKLQESYTLSISRSRQMWISLGVPEDIAGGLSGDHSVGAALGAMDPGLYVLIGDQGSGKTLAAERLFQESTQRALSDLSQPFPLFINARDLSEPLEDYIDRMGHYHSFSPDQGTVVVVDGVDEVGVTEANTLLNKVSAYARAHLKTLALATTRPLPGLKNLGERIEMPLLSNGDAINLTARIAGESFEPNMLHSWSNTIRTSMNYPLFAVLLSLELREGSGVHGALSKAELVDRLAQAALMESGGPREKVDRLLQTLAVKGISSGGRVPKGEVSHLLSEQRLLSDSRLVSEHDGALDFTFSIFREWFAARAIVEQEISLEGALTLSDRWVTPLAIVLGSEDESASHALISTLASADPGLASLVLQEHEPLGNSYGTNPPIWNPPSRQVKRYVARWRLGGRAWETCILPLDP